jgi:hypothetical protein
MRSGQRFRLLLLLASYAAVRLATTVPPNLPFQVVTPSPDHSVLQPDADGLATLAKHEGTISLISVVGPYHSGKSFLLNALAGDMQTFKVGPQTSPQTMGIWLCRTNMTARDGSEVWLMDSEGFFGPGVDEGYDAKVFTVASLVGAHLIYNTVKVIDQQAVQLLEMLLQRAQLFRTRTSNLSPGSIAAEIPDFLSIDSFPPLTWVVEDFVQKLPNSVASEGPTAWLRTYLEASAVPGASAVIGRQANVDTSRHLSIDDTGISSSEMEARGDTTNFLTSLFRDVRVHTLFLPATSREHLQDLSLLSWDELTKEFRDEVSSLRMHVLRSLEPRVFRGKKVTGPALAKELRFVVEGLQKGMLQELPSLWRSWITQVEEVSINDADALFAKLAQSFDDKGDEPVPLATFNQRLEEAREKATTFYHALIRDFNLSPRIGQLRKRLEWHVGIVSTTYHDRIRRWIADLTASTKDKFARKLAARALPVDPGEIEKEGEAMRSELAQVFSDRLKAFGAAPSRPWLALARSTVTTPLAVSMPPFNPDDPATQVAADLRAHLAAHVLENDHAVQQLFKRAVAAADAAAERIFNASNGRPLNGKQLAGIQDSAEQSCWRAFDHELSSHTWATKHSFYKHHRLLIQEELLKGRKAKLIAANEQLLTAAFRTHVDRWISQYHASVSRMAMPIAEDVIDAEHSKIASVAQTSMTSTLGNFSDTLAFENAKSRLKQALEEGLVHVREKNYEFWKVHSDRATRCAVALNKEKERACGFIFCLSSWVPWAHKASSRWHLKQCFKQHISVGSGLSSSLQNHVFEIWYKKDLGHDEERVSTRFLPCW